jgi:UV radiation resistance-associated gene protein
MSVVPKSDGVFGATPVCTSEFFGSLAHSTCNVLISPFALQRRVRHISSIQVRNLTPFPVRDAFATALSQPSEKPQFTEFGHLSDDLDVTLSRKRSRRISSNSIATYISRRSDDSALDDQPTDAKSKKVSRLSFSASGTIKPSTSLGAPATPLSGGAPTLRSPGHRVRASSIASSLNAPFNVATASFAPSTTAGPSTSAVTMSLSAMLPDHSQAELEKVIKSRLVETFVAITVPTPVKVPPAAVRNEHEKASRSRPSTPVSVVPSRRDTALSTNHRSASSITTKVSKLTQSDTRKPAIARTEPPKSPPSPMRNGPGHSRTPTATSVRINGKAGAPPSPTKRPPPPDATPKRSISPAKRPSSPYTPPALPVPNYLSKVHRPSTNPSFAIDARPGCEFAEWTDLSAEKIKVEIWGRVGNEWRSRRDQDVTVKAKGKEKEEPASDLNDGWKVLQEWSFDMADLVPLPDNVSPPRKSPTFRLLMPLLS